MCSIFSFFFFLMIRRPPRSPLFPSTPLFRSALDGALVVELADPPHETPDLVATLVAAGARITGVHEDAATLEEVDRKSTRLNSSHGYISYAVFCLKKKKNTTGTKRSTNYFSS